MDNPRFFRPRTARWLLAVAAAVSTSLMFSTPAHAAAPTGRYVALGDSYTAGPLIPNQVDLNCLRSDHNYPTLASASIHSSSFVDVSCSGATTNDVLNPGSGELVPGQYLRSLRGPIEFAVFAADDPLPAAMNMPMLMWIAARRRLRAADGR